ncbi:1169_t:CDS:2 [Cetraspora pellucida]|uniref:1169_t:CDS:1 n=1 Tax=Cetraspora pellucida TaxID=1433469 RepID=A0ACA9NFB6_9GLOM|nr:1169_t:CDS:2 [Cetraspora pellucida]
MEKDIKNYIETCNICQRSVGKSERFQMTKPIKTTSPFVHIRIDFVGPLKITSQENCWIIVATDYFTKWPEAKAVPAATAKKTSKFLYENIICQHGVPTIIQSDRVQAVSCQEPKVLATQEIYVVIDSEVSNVFNEENVGLEKEDDALFTLVGNTYTDTTKQIEHLEDFSADNLYINNNNDLDTNNVNKQILTNINLDNNIKIDQSQIKAETAEEELTKDILKKLNNFLMENYFIDTDMIVDPLATLYDDSNIAETFSISNDDNKFKLVVLKKKHKGKAKVSNAEKNQVMSLDSKKNPGLRTKRP